MRAISISNLRYTENLYVFNPVILTYPQVLILTNNLPSYSSLFIILPVLTIHINTNTLTDTKSHFYRFFRPLH